MIISSIIGGNKHRCMRGSLRAYELFRNRRCRHPSYIPKLVCGGINSVISLVNAIVVLRRE